MENEYSNNEITILICLQSTEYRIFGYPLSSLVSTRGATGGPGTETRLEISEKSGVFLRLYYPLMPYTRQI